jgi:hypothetical protein
MSTFNSLLSPDRIIVRNIERSLDKMNGGWDVGSIWRFEACGQTPTHSREAAIHPDMTKHRTRELATPDHHNRLPQQTHTSQMTGWPLDIYVAELDQHMDDIRKNEGKTAFQQLAWCSCEAEEPGVKERKAITQNCFVSV